VNNKLANTVAAVELTADENPDIIYRELYSGHKVYTRKTQGFYQRLRRYAGMPLLLAFFLTPWLTIDGRPAVFFDLGALKFHVLWATFWPQDGILLAWLLIIAAFALFTVTVWAGRVWCGFSCPQTVWTLMFIWAEEKCEGNRNKRIKLDAAPWGVEKVLRKSSKHAVWLLISLLTAITFVAYFYGVQDLLADASTLNAAIETYFWLGLFSLLTYLNAGWLREQVCKHMCPYSRFQSAMYDQDTLLVAYNRQRGETRGPRKPKANALLASNSTPQGDCIDCSWCVQVCPADIDIRDGLQAECINCGLCVDACDTVMDKMGLARGLISYASENGGRSSWRRLLRPRMLAYSVMLGIMIAVFSLNIGSRIPLSVDVIRDRGVNLYRVRGEFIENVYTVKLNNMSDTAETFILSIQANNTYQIRGRRRVYLESGEVFTIPIRVAALKDSLIQSKNEISIVASGELKPEIQAMQNTLFFAPDR